MFKILREEFGGIKAEQDERIKAIPKSQLTNLSICDLRYLEEYEAEFKKYFYRAGMENDENAKNMYFHKLPYPLGEKIQNDYESNPEVNKKLNTLGGRTIFAHHNLSPYALIGNVRKYQETS